MGIDPRASYVGAPQVRANRVVLGDGDVQPTARATGPACASLVRDAMKDGAVGVSTAVSNTRLAPHAKTEELIALASEASNLGGIYATHMRDESDSVLPAIDEALRIGREAHIPVEIWHIKVAGKNNWGRMPEVVAKINTACAAGADISPTPMPTLPGSTTSPHFVPPWAHDGGSERWSSASKIRHARTRIRKDMLTPSTAWDNEWQEIPGPDAIMIGAVLNPQLLPLQGKANFLKSLSSRNKDPLDTIFDFFDPGSAL